MTFSQGGPFCPGATPSIELKTVQHIFDAYVYKLPDHEFTAPLAEATEAEVATSEAEVSTIKRSTTSDGPNPHNSSTVVEFCEKHSAGAKSMECFSSSSGGSRSNSLVKESASSRIEDESDNTRKLLHCCSDAVGATQLVPPPQQQQQQQQFVGDDVVIPRMRFKWVSEDAGEPGPHVAVMADGWGGAVRAVRFRLTDVWLSCEQVYLSIRTVIHSLYLYRLCIGGTHLLQGPLLPGGTHHLSGYIHPFPCF